jgi:serine/threonine protein phosphatase 1
VIFVGDYVNRGPDSYLVLEELAELHLVLGDRLSLLLGNHESALLEFLDGGSKSRFLQHGGLQTVNSYMRRTNADTGAHPLDTFRSTFPVRHRQLLEAMALAYETDEILVTHAGFNPNKPRSRSLDDVVLGRHAELFMSRIELPRPLVVCGHYVQRSMTPFTAGDFICLDSGCGTIDGAPLSILTLPNREIHTFHGE